MDDILKNSISLEFNEKSSSESKEFIPKSKTVKLMTPRKYQSCQTILIQF